MNSLEAFLDFLAQQNTVRANVFQIVMGHSPQNFIELGAPLALGTLEPDFHEILPAHIDSTEPVSDSTNECQNLGELPFLQVWVEFVNQVLTFLRGKEPYQFSSQIGDNIFDINRISWIFLKWGNFFSGWVRGVFGQILFQFHRILKTVGGVSTKSKRQLSGARRAENSHKGFIDHPFLSELSEPHQLVLLIHPFLGKQLQNLLIPQVYILSDSKLFEENSLQAIQFNIPLPSHLSPNPIQNQLLILFPFPSSHPSTPQPRSLNLLFFQIFVRQFPSPERVLKLVPDFFQPPPVQSLITTIYFDGFYKGPFDTQVNVQKYLSLPISQPSYPPYLLNLPPSRAPTPIFKGFAIFFGMTVGFYFQSNVRESWCLKWRLPEESINGQGLELQLPGPNNSLRMGAPADSIRFQKRIVLLQCHNSRSLIDGQFNSLRNGSTFPASHKQNQQFNAIGISQNHFILIVIPPPSIINQSAGSPCRGSKGRLDGQEIFNKISFIRVRTWGFSIESYGLLQTSDWREIEWRRMGSIWGTGKDIGIQQPIGAIEIEYLIM